MAKQRTPKSVSQSTIRFSATLLLPKSARPVSWLFLKLPKSASAKLPSRGQVTIEGTINDQPFQATLDPDGQGGHWMKVDRKLRRLMGQSKAGDAESELAEAGDVVVMEVVPVPADREPEPKVPTDLKDALASAMPKAREVWSDITPLARRDWVHWITSAKQDETRARRITNACDMLAKGKRRPCCFDRSGMYSKSLQCPEPA